jgi:hypothetical protein
MTSAPAAVNVTGEPAGVLDRLIEGAGRWIAGRTTRRSFLGMAGRAGVLVAGGSSMAVLLADQAQARVCGQTGVAPKCETFACNATWGWCWYSTGVCCANGATKKICDCCAPNTPHPVGYCPSGTRVLCILESCGADPRATPKPTVVLGTADPVAVSVSASRAIHERAAVVVISDAQSPSHAAVAAAVAGIAAGPMLLTARGGLDATVAEEIRRLRADHALVVGHSLSEAVDDALRAQGLFVQRLGSGNPAQWSNEVALWVRERTGGRTAIVLTGEIAPHVAGAVAGVAGTRRWPVLLGTGDAVRPALAAPRPVRRTIVVTDDAQHAQDLPHPDVIASADPTLIASGLADRLVQAGWNGTPIGIACERDPGAATALSTLGGPVLLHRAGTLDGARDWLLSHRARAESAYVSGDRRTFPAQAEYDTQALLNFFETHHLQGGPGQGLPVMSQPLNERPIGRARW